MTKAFVDTTILADAALKSSPYNKAARDALKRFNRTLLPMYAIKEFKAGPLTNYVWLHNKFATLQSFHKTIAALQRMSMSPRRYRTSTALEALRDAAKTTGTISTQNLVERYGDKAREDSIVADRYRLALKYRIFKAWRLRRTLTSEVIIPLSCYKEIAPFEHRGLIETKPTACDTADCCLTDKLRSRLSDLESLKNAIGTSNNRERQRRYQVLRHLIRKPKEPMTDDMCRSLGDAVFAFFAPSDCVILTTNVKDHQPLAASLGKKVESP